MLQKPVSSEVIVILGTSPVTVDDVKVQARIDYDIEDSLIQLYIDSAIDFCELELQQKVIRQRVRLTFNGFGGACTGLLLSGLGRHAEVESVTYIDESEVERTIPVNEYRIVNAAQKYVMPSGDMLLNRWPDQSRTNNTVEVVATCGFDTVPAGVKQWIQIIAATSYAQREKVTTSQTYDLNFIDRLIDVHRLPVV